MKLRKLAALLTMLVGMSAFSLTAYASEDFKPEEFTSVDISILPDADETIDLGGGVSAYYFAEDNTVIIHGEGKMNDFTELLTHSPSPFYNKFDGEYDVYISDDVSYLGIGLFESMNCRNVYVGSGVEEIGKECFTLSSIHNIDFSKAEKLTEIPEQCFYGCNDLETVLMPENLTSLSGSAFIGNISMKEITLPITYYVSKDVKLPNSVSVFNFTKGTGDRIDYDYNDSMYVAWNTCDNVTINLADDITYIPAFMFTNNNISEINLPESLQEIGKGAFIGSDITSITIPMSVTKIGDDAFASCSYLTPNTVIFEGNKDNVSMSDTAFEYGFWGDKDDSEIGETPLQKIKKPENAEDAEEKESVTEAEETKSEKPEQAAEKSEKPSAEKEKGFNWTIILIVIIVIMAALLLKKKKEDGSTSDDSWDEDTVRYYSDEENVCPECGAANKADKRFCTKCGHRLHWKTLE